MFNQYEDILRVDEVAEVLGSGKNTIYALLIFRRAERLSYWTYVENPQRKCRIICQKKCRSAKIRKSLGVSCS